MKTATILVAACIAAPAAAFAQTSYSRAAVTGPLVVPAEPVYPVYPANPPATCVDLQNRKAALDDEKIDYDRERDLLDAEAASLARELRDLDSANAAAVAAYNARSDDHNRRVAEHNRRVADMNGEVARVTADMANNAAYCNDWRAWR